MVNFQVKWASQFTPDKSNVGFEKCLGDGESIQQLAQELFSQEQITSGIVMSNNSTEFSCSFVPYNFLGILAELLEELSFQFCFLYYKVHCSFSCLFHLGFSSLNFCMKFERGLICLLMFYFCLGTLFQKEMPT